MSFYLFIPLSTQHRRCHSLDFAHSRRPGAGSGEAGVQRFGERSPHFDSGLISAPPGKPKHKLESLDPAHSLSRKITFLSHFLSWLTGF